MYMSKFTKITSVQQLKEDCTDQLKCYFIWFGGLRSSKNIMYDSDDRSFEVNNEIDDTDQILKEDELFTESNIGEAIKEGKFYKY